MFHLVCLESPLDTYFFSQYSHLIFRIKECVLYVFSESQANQQFLNFKIYFIWIYYMVPKIYIDFEDMFTNFTLNFECIYFIFKSHISNSMLIMFHLVCLQSPFFLSPHFDVYFCSYIINGYNMFLYIYIQCKNLITFFAFNFDNMFTYMCCLKILLGLQATVQFKQYDVLSVVS